MRGKALLVSILCLWHVQDNLAQRHYTGISGVEIDYGTNIFGRSNTHLGLNFSKYRSRTTYWKLGLNFFEKSFHRELQNEETGEKLPYNSTGRDYFVNADYYKTVATNMTSLYFSLGIGAFTGVEYYKMPQKEYDFLLGPKVGIEIEYFILPRIALLGKIDQYWSPFSDLSRWNTVWNTGVKFLIY